MNILDFPEDLILEIFVPLNINQVFNNNSWLFTCKKFYNLQNKIINTSCIKNDKAVCKIINIVIKLRFNKIDYITMKTYTSLLSLFINKNNVYFDDKILENYVNSLIESLAIHIFDKLERNKKLTAVTSEKNFMIEAIYRILLWIISYNEMLKIKINQGMLQSKIDMFKSRVIDNIIQSDIIRSIKNKDRFDAVHEHFLTYNVKEKIEIMCIKNGKFIIYVANMFNSIVGNNSRIRLTDIKTKDYNEFVDEDTEDNNSYDDDYYDDYDPYCEIGYYDEVTRFYIDQYNTKYHKINHFY